MTALTCKHCNRHMGEAEAFVGELLCANSKCKGTTQFKIIKSDNSALFSYKFAKPEKPPKTQETQDA